METPMLPEEVRAGLPAVARAYIGFLEAQVAALREQVLALEAATATLGAQVAG